jgi:hypothetical protein
MSNNVSNTASHNTPNVPQFTLSLPNIGVTFTCTAECSDGWGGE